VAAIHRKSIRDLAIIYIAAWLRSFGIGLLGVVLGVFLYREGFSSTAIGLVIAAGLAGAATGTVFITFKADHLGRRQTLFALSLLTAAGSLFGSSPVALPIELPVAGAAKDAHDEFQLLVQLGRQIAERLVAKRAEDWLKSKLGR